LVFHQSPIEAGISGISLLFPFLRVRVVFEIGQRLFDCLDGLLASSTQRFSEQQDAAFKAIPKSLQQMEE
jgi:hypothetical protein